jgi:uracil DNA glycosylase superfamily protein/uncharacterized protein DUF1643
MDKKDVMQRTNSDPDSRPYMGSCHPAEAEVLFVGYNPATKLSKPGTDFLDSHGTPKLTVFDQFYGDEREKQLTKGGKPKKRKSRTRERIDEIVHGLSAERWIMTNVYWTPSEQQRDLKAGQLNAENFTWLLNQCQKAKVIIAYGNPAIKSVNELVARIPEENRPRVVECKHLSYGLRKQYLQDKINEARDAINKKAGSFQADFGPGSVLI